MKKIVSVFSTLILAFVALTFNGVAANAASIPVVWFDGTQEARIGDQVSWDWGCAEGDSTVSWGSGTLPDGLTISQTGVVTGSPTTVGSYDLYSYSCQTSPTSSVGYPGGHVHITIRPEVDPVTPPALLSVSYSNDADCTLHVVASLPATNDAGTLGFTLTDGTRDMRFSLKDHVANELIAFSIPLRGNLNDLLTGNGEIVAISSNDAGAQTVFCGDDVRAGIGYQAGGAPLATTLSPWIETFGPPTYYGEVLLSANTDEFCSFDAIINITKLPTNGRTLTAYVNTTGGAIRLPLGNVVLNEPFKINVPVLDPQSTLRTHLSGDPVVINNPRCGTAHAGLSLVEDGETIAEAADYSIAGASQLYCNPGRFSQDGFCVPSELGFYVPLAGATSQLACPAGQTTEFTGTTALIGCFKAKTQSVLSLKTSKAMKLRATIALPAKTSAGVAARVQASGACTAVPVAAGGKINGKKVSVASVSVKASSRTGVCTLVFTSERLGRYAALTKTVSIKVTKTGK